METNEKCIYGEDVRIFWRREADVDTGLRQAEEYSLLTHLVRRVFAVLIVHTHRSLLLEFSANQFARKPA